MKNVWICEWCSRPFETKEEAEDCEETCLEKGVIKYSNRGIITRKEDGNYYLRNGGGFSIHTVDRIYVPNLIKALQRLLDYEEEMEEAAEPIEK